MFEGGEQYLLTKRYAEPFSPPPPSLTGTSAVTSLRARLPLDSQGSRRHDRVRLVAATTHHRRKGNVRFSRVAVTLYSEGGWCRHVRARRNDLFASSDKRSKGPRGSITDFVQERQDSLLPRRDRGVSAPSLRIHCEAALGKACQIRIDQSERPRRSSTATSMATV